MEHKAAWERDGVEIGRILRRARRELGMSLDEVEQATKIRKHYLESLEREDYDAMPAPVYAHGFLKSYATYVGLDGEELSRKLAERWKPAEGLQQEAVSAPPGASGRTLRRRSSGVGGRRRFSLFPALTLLAGVLVVGAVVWLLYTVGQDARPTGAEAGNEPPQAAQPQEDPRDEDPRDEDPQAAEPGQREDAQQEDAGPAGGSPEAQEENSPPPQEENAEARQPPEPEPEAEPAASETLRIEVRLDGDTPTWVQVWADEQVAYADVAEPGFTQTFEAGEKISINTGNAGAVNVKINGQDLGALGPSGQVLTRDFTLKDAA